MNDFPAIPLLEHRPYDRIRELYLLQEPMLLAGDLLLTTEQSLAQVADTCGFCDQSHFTHIFQDVKGVTPKLFRKNCQPKHTDTKQMHRQTRRPGRVQFRIGAL